MSEFPPPPMPSSVDVAATIRYLGTTEILVAVITLHDVTGDFRVFDLEPTVAADLALDLLRFVRQVGIPGRR